MTNTMTPPRLSSRFEDALGFAPKLHATSCARARASKFLVRGGKFEKLEGNWEPTRVVLLEFPSLEQAKRWYDSEEYREPKALRFKTARTNLILVEGAS